MTAHLKIHYLNESYTAIEGTPEQLIEISNFLRVERPNAWFDVEVKRGRKSPYDYFAVPQNGTLLVQNGHLELLGTFGIKPKPVISVYNNSDIDEFMGKIIDVLPFTPHDFQEKAFRESVLNVKQINKMCTSSGKSLTISLLCEFFRLKGKKGLILVPNINLLTQFKSDIYDYNLKSLYKNTHTIGGGQTIRHFEMPLTISTWQSLQNYHGNLSELDYIICDEVHRFASEETSAIIKKTTNCKYKIGFTGTIPESPIKKMELIGMFGLPKTYITSKELIDRGLATPIYINSIIFDYPKDFKKEIRLANSYTQRLKLLKEHKGRTDFIVNLTIKLRDTGNTLVLFQHTEHGKTIFYETMAKLFPDVHVENKNIVGKKSFDFQSQHGIYFLNGEDDAKTREKTRLILNEHNNAIIIANYAILSTGVNIKRLFNMILASPIKSYETITQSIGRMMRLYPGKEKAQIFDLVDNTGARTLSGPFIKQYKHRKATSYSVEEFPIKEIVFELNK